MNSTLQLDFCTFSNIQLHFKEITYSIIYVDITSVPDYCKNEYIRRNNYIKNKEELCLICGGLGYLHHLYYSKCNKCKGIGIKK